MNSPYQWSSAAALTARIAADTVAVITGWRNSPVARSYSRRHSKPSTVTAAMVQIRPSSTGPIINGSSTAQAAVRTHSSRRNPGFTRPVADSAPMMAHATPSTPTAANTMKRLTGCAKAVLIRPE